jgi:choice-of-anchor B domain-containing protein
LHIVDVANPSNPTLAGGWEQGYIHDAQVVIYNGPDDDHVGKEIAFAFGGFSGCYIIDVEDKTDCQTLSSLSDEAWVYSHQGWLTEDHRFVLVNDEIDESTGIAPLTRTWVLDVQDLDNPSVIGFHEGTLGVTDHNLYTHQGLVYEANYYAGLQILDVVDPEALAFEQVAFFDTNPFSNQVGTSGGAWNVYPYFESGNIAISTQSHLFVVAPSEPVSGVQESASAAALDVRSGDGIIYTTLGASQSQNLKVFDALGRLKAEWLALPEVTMQWMVSDWDPGVYVVRSADGAQARFVVD